MTYMAVRFRDHVRMIFALESHGLEGGKVLAAFDSDNACRCPTCVVTFETIKDMARKFRLMPTKGEC